MSFTGSLLRLTLSILLWGIWWWLLYLGCLKCPFKNILSPFLWKALTFLFSGRSLVFSKGINHWQQKCHFFVPYNSIQLWLRKESLFFFSSLHCSRAFWQAAKIVAKHTSILRVILWRCCSSRTCTYCNGSPWALLQQLEGGRRLGWLPPGTRTFVPFTPDPLWRHCRGKNHKTLGAFVCTRALAVGGGGRFNWSGSERCSN